MKLIVDIPKNCIEDLENIGLEDLNEEVVFDIVCCIRNGISLEKNTNGEVIKTLFTNVYQNEEHFFKDTISWYPKLSNGLYDEVHFDEKWWNELYKENNNEIQVYY